MYIISALYNAKVIETRSVNDIVNLLYCEPLKSECLYRTCAESCTKNIKAKRFMDKSVTCYKWTTESTKCTIRGKEKLIRKTIKSSISIRLVNLYNEFQDKLSSFLNHVGNILHQYQAISSLKESMQLDKILIHVDFSENFSYKYGEEVQSFYFGGSRAQISLHTGIIYMRDGQGKLTPRSFCTISRPLRHDYIAIWAHLKIMFDWLDEIKTENISKVHFLSDGPATQYRNRSMFQVISKYSKHINQVLNVLHGTILKSVTAKVPPTASRVH